MYLMLFLIPFQPWSCQLRLATTFPGTETVKKVFCFQDARVSVSLRPISRTDPFMRLPVSLVTGRDRVGTQVPFFYGTSFSPPKTKMIGRDIPQGPSRSDVLSSDAFSEVSQRPYLLDQNEEISALALSPVKLRGGDNAALSTTKRCWGAPMCKKVIIINFYKSKL